MQFLTYRKHEIQKNSRKQQKCKKHYVFCRSCKFLSSKSLLFQLKFNLTKTNFDFPNLSCFFGACLSDMKQLQLVDDIPR